MLPEGARVLSGASEKSSRRRRATPPSHARPPSPYQKTVLDYYANLWQTDGRSVDDLLADLPPALRTRLSTIVNRNVIKCERLTGATC